MKTKLRAPKFKIALLLIIISITVTALTACTSATPFTSEPAAAPPPTIKFLVPGENNGGGLGLTGENWFPILVEVSNFELVDKVGEPNVPGEGHIHFFFDVIPPVESGKPAVTAPGTYVDTADTYYYWHDIGEGEHAFSAELVNNDHTPLDPPVFDMITVSTDIYWDG